MIDSRLKKGLGRGLSSLLGDTTKKLATKLAAWRNLTRAKMPSFNPNFDPRKSEGR